MVADTPPLDRNALKGSRVLVVDDDADARELCSSALALYGATVTSAASATAALAVVDAAAPDVVVSDISMPDHDGYWLVDQLHQRGLRVPVVAMTAFGRQHSRQAAFAAGFGEYLSKPFDPLNLCDVIARVIAARA